MPCRNTLVLLASLLLPACMAAQARPTATRDITFQVGGDYSFANPDYGSKYIKGIGIYGDVDFRRHLGVDVEFHDDTIVTPLDTGEDSAIVSLRYIWNYHRFQPYLRVGGGLGRLVLQNFGTASNHGVIALGGGIDYRLMNHIHLRPVDFEYQHWNFTPNGLTPYVFSFGAAYAF